MPADLVLDQIAALVCPTVPREVLARGITAWIQLFGVSTFELFGRFQNLIEDSRDHRLRVTAGHVGSAVTGAALPGRRGAATLSG